MSNTQANKLGEEGYSYVLGLVKRSSLAIGLVILMLVASMLSTSGIFWKYTIDREFHVHYSRQANLATGLNLIANKGDKILMISDKSLLVWQSKLSPSEGFIFFFKWMWQVPEFKRLVVSAQKLEPEFISGEKVNECVGLSIPKGYCQLYYQGEGSNIYARRDVCNRITDQQKIDLKYLSIEII